MNKIFIIGSTNTDMVIKTDQLPVPGETRLGGHFFMNGGGKGANQAVAAARLGGDTTLITKLGKDIFGSQALENFQKEKIHSGYVFIDDTAASGTALIMVNTEGENCIAVAPGANAHLLPADMEKVKNFHEAVVILVQLEIPMETIEWIAEKAKINQQQLIINPAPAQKLSGELLDGLFLITPNETEAAWLTGIQVSDEKSASDAATVFLQQGVENVIITLGRQGAYFRNKELNFIVCAPAVKAMDTTAAGDVFSGAIAVALSEKMDWKRALEFAVQAASISVTRLGAQSSAPFRKETDPSFQ